MGRQEGRTAVRQRDQHDWVVQGARVSALVAAGLLLANCSQNSGSRVDARLGVSASERVVGPGEAVPKGGGTYRVGKPYTVAGRVYVPEENPRYKAEGIASWYGDDFHGRKTANGEIFDMTSISAAHPTLPIPSYVRVTNLRNHRSLIVRVNDRGPYAHDRIIDLSTRAAKLLEFHGHGIAKVRVEYVGKAPLSGSDDMKLAATLRENGRPVHDRPTAIAAMREPAREPTKRVAVASADPSFAPSLLDSRPMAQRPAVAREEAEPAQSEQAEPAMAGNRYVLASHSRPGAVESAPISQPMPAPRQMAAQVAAQVAAPTQNSLAPRNLGVLHTSSSSPASSPVSAYAPTRYDGSAGLMSGRGLY